MALGGRARHRLLTAAAALGLAACLSGPPPTAPPASPTPDASRSGAPSPSPTRKAAPSPGASALSSASAGPPSSSPSATAGASPTPKLTTKPTAAPTAAPTSAPTAAPTPAPTPPPATWDPNRVSVTLGKIADVPGRPLAIANAGDGSGRLFVAEQGGRVYIIDGGAVGGPFLDISGQVSSGGEQGLLGLAFHPDFPADPRVFVDYTDTSGDTVVSSFTVDPGSPDVAMAGSEVVVLAVDQPYANHNGGAIAFGPDGYLYIALGDGGSGGDPQNNGQRLDTLLGKILRIDVDAGSPYGIPAGNPFASTPGARDEIWLTGLRNPWRFSFDRSTGDLWIGDVGQNAWEEVDVARSGGLNFGWRTMEGAHCYTPSSGCSTAGLTLPVAEYDHAEGCAIVGGNVYRGSAQPVLRGGYVFSDNCTGRIWAIAATATSMQPLVRVGTGAAGVAGYGEDEAGELYAADLGGGVYRVVGTAR